MSNKRALAAAEFPLHACQTLGAIDRDQHRAIEMIDLLVGRGVEREIGGPADFSALELAAVMGNARVVSKLPACRANPCRASNGGADSILHSV